MATGAGELRDGPSAGALAIAGRRPKPGNPPKERQEPTSSSTAPPSRRHPCPDVTPPATPRRNTPSAAASASRLAAMDRAAAPGAHAVPHAQQVHPRRLTAHRDRDGVDRGAGKRHRLGGAKSDRRERAQKQLPGPCLEGERKQIEAPAAASSHQSASASVVQYPPRKAGGVPQSRGQHQRSEHPEPPAPPFTRARARRANETHIPSLGNPR